MPPGPVSAPPPFPVGPPRPAPGRLGSLLFNYSKRGSLPSLLHFVIIFSSGICYRIKTKRKKKKKKKHIVFASRGSWVLEYLLSAPRGAVLFCFAELWINKLCSFLTAPHLDELAGVDVNRLLAEHVVWITSLLRFSEGSRSWTGVSFLVSRSIKKKSVRAELKKKKNFLSPWKSQFISPITIPVMACSVTSLFIAKPQSSL